jgi:magnesium-transporting ATPase (P-type)
VTPEDKLRVALALQRRGHVVAMTGDGVNDGPALQAADIGVAMGLSGTDVAREAADLVLLDDDFTTIVSAVQHGRVTFANMRRFLTYHLVCNVAELTPFVLWAVSGGQFPLALGVLQILCFDIGADVLPALALGVERASSTASLRPLTGRHLIDRRLLSRVFLVLGPTEAIMEILAFVVVLMSFGWTPSHPITNTTGLLSASGTAFATVILSQVAVAFACRSATQWPGLDGSQIVSSSLVLRWRSPSLLASCSSHQSQNSSIRRLHRQLDGSWLSSLYQCYLVSTRCTSSRDATTSSTLASITIK